MLLIIFLTRYQNKQFLFHKRVSHSLSLLLNGESGFLSTRSPLILMSMVESCCRYSFKPTYSLH